MVDLLSIIALGFFLGMRHATDPDHVIAVSTIVSRQHDCARSALIGAFWGLGHTLTILVVGAAIILFNLVIPPRIGLSMELSVGFMLIILGLLNVRGFLRSMHISARAQGKSGFHFPEDHPHRSDQTSPGHLDRNFGRFGRYQHVRPLIVGIVHGLAGSGAVALLVLATIRNSDWAAAYLLVFGAGTIAGMMLITMSLASTLRLTRRSENVSRGLAMASGLLSLCFGVVVTYQICFVRGLFSGVPNWIPR